MAAAAAAAEEFAEEEEAAPAKAAVVYDDDGRVHLNIIFIGHVDAGKSTISGQIMYLTGMLDDRTLEKFERESKAKGRESWKFAWALDTTEQERAKGKTEQVGRAFFVTESKRYTILDAPGHKAYVPHMIGGAAQADVGILVISARKGEFETGFERGGQTREHAMLVKTAGVRQLVVVINKMDDPTVEWSQERYDECVGKLTPYLRQVGYSPKHDITFLPISGLTGFGVKDRIPDGVCPWYSGPSLLELLDSMKAIERMNTGSFRMPINEKYREMGIVVMGKIEGGRVTKGEHLMLMPNRVNVEVSAIQGENGGELERAHCGDNIKLRLRGVEEEDVRCGYVLAELVHPCPVVRTFDAHIAILEHKSIICAGFSAVMHVHSAVEEITLEKLLAVVDRKTNKIATKLPKFVKPGQTVLARVSCAAPICVETFKDYPQLGRFVLRDEGKTIAVGKVIRLSKESE